MTEIRKLLNSCPVFLDHLRLVYLTNSKYPDLIVGTIVFFIVGQGAFKILKLSK
jgi:Co/Zn/Cd efflux system component